MQTSFLSNNYKKGKKVINAIENELKQCTSFKISVAFITIGGITPLLETLKELEQKNIPGEILTTDYLTFSDPRALEKLHKLKNIKIRMYRCKKAGFHTKGYMFEKPEEYHIIVGSSNLTLNALTINWEWNTQYNVCSDHEMKQEIYNEFEELWNSENTYDYENFIQEYSLQYKKNQQIQLPKHDQSQSTTQLLPNSMQKVLIQNFLQSIDNNQHRGLLISATGTGKTYASAFALREISPKRILFLVHRELICKQAMASYQRVFGPNHTFGLLSGNSKDYESDYIFSTMQMMSKNETLQQFKPNDFDIIVIDEVHRAGALSYQKIMNYFQPDYWFGMSASPERSDDFDIYSLFDHNILYEIRLQQALEENLLCPFHYFGISDLEINGQVFDDQTQFNQLVCDARVNHIIDKIQYYGYSGNRVKGLIFVSRKEEAIELSNKFNQKGYHTACLFGSDSTKYREECIDRLVNDQRQDTLDYIFTIDIFNEGIDIPEINQVVMLRPTQSAIIFVQQLGRGLRKKENKEFVVIIDFIGNYRNNFLIPIALSGDRSYNKDTTRKYIQEGSKIIPGSSTIHFDEISRTRIYESLDAANFNDVRLIRDSYNELRNKLGRIPNLKEFDIYGSIDPLRIFDNKSLGSYHMYLKKYEKEYDIQFDSKQEKYLEYISKKFASGKRPHELLIIKHLLYDEHKVFENLEKTLKERNNLKLKAQTKTNLINLLTNQFATGSGRKTYSTCIFIQKEDHDYGISKTFKKALQNQEFKKQIEELVDFGLYRNNKEYSKTYKNTQFNLYAKYTYEDVCRLLDWKENIVPLNIGGYKYDKDTKTYPIFINYDKSDDISETIKYEDQFITPNKLIAISKSKRTIESEDVQTALHSKKLGVNMELFIRKNKDDKVSKEFYYLGKIHPTGKTSQFTMPNTDITAVKIEYELQTSVEESLYNYLIN